MSDNLPPLLPCPFCGGAARIAFEEYDFNGAQIECKECHASGGHHSDDKHGDAAADSWNRRAAIEANTPAVPDGWKLVPVEPTDAMLEAARTCHKGRMYPQDDKHGPAAMRRREFVSMLAAAPQPQPVAQPVQDQPSDMLEGLK